MRFASLFPVIFAALAAGCTGYDTQVPLPETGSALRVTPLIRSLEVRDVSLPRYAASDDILFLDDSGALDTVPGMLWADTPERAATLALVEDLGQITGARVAAEPWPFSQPPDALTVVRVSRMHGTADGIFRLQGQYAIAPVASGLADRSGQFDIQVPVQGDTPLALARAQSLAFTQLAETIARRIGR